MEWKFLTDKNSNENIKALSGKLRMSPAMCAVLSNRGITPETADGFFDSHVLHDPFLMRDMQKAAERLRLAIQNGEKICIYGDYDVDGIASTAMLLLYLKGKGADCTYYIPKREEEGYGVNEAAVRSIAQDGGATLIVTVDTGISAVSEAELAASLGVDMIITDHHECGEILPDVCAVVDPKRPDCTYPFKSLAGAGVAFKLICALEGDSPKCLEEWGEYVALATLADVVPLVDENRTVTRAGTEKMRAVPIAWLDEILKGAGIEKSSLSSYQLAFMVAPRVNAAGRLNNPYLALNMLLARDEQLARAIYPELEKANTERKALCDAVFRDAMTQLDRESTKKVLVLAGDGWSAGVIGIVASRISEMFYKSVVMIALSDGVGKGSARAIQGLKLYDALSFSKSALEKFGGHEKAAGLAVREENIPEFDRLINEFADREMRESDLVPKVYIDCALSCESDLMQLCREQLLLEPFGEGNKKPVFAVLGARISSLRKTRDGKHLMMKFVKRGRTFSSIGFGLGRLAETYKEGDTVDIAANLEINEYMGNVTAQFQIIDIKNNA